MSHKLQNPIYNLEGKLPLQNQIMSGNISKLDFSLNLPYHPQEQVLRKTHFT